MNNNYYYPNRVILPYQYSNQQQYQFNNSTYVNDDFRAEMGLDLYGYDKGYQLGNMFKNLYEGYKNIEPTVKASNDREKRLNEVGALSFAAHDLNLYLDIYPNNREALNQFYRYRSLADEKLKSYEDTYGALNVTSNAINKYPWSWIKSPWPWEGED